MAASAFDLVWEGMKAEAADSMETVKQYVQIYRRAIEDYKQGHPHWRIEVLVSLIKWSLRSLRHYIENAKDSEITWDSPFVELHYPVDWDWKGRGNGDIAPGGYVFGKITKQNTTTKAMAVQTLSGIMTRQFNATALADATNWAWYEKRKNYYTPVLPLQGSTELSTIKNRRQRRACFDELVRPFSIGATRIDASILELKSGERGLLESQSQMDVPGIRFTGDVNGRKFDMGLIFEIHPLIADYDTKRAYHPVVVGLAVLNARLVEDEVVQDTPANWPKKDRKEFWDGLLREMDKITALLIPKPEVEESVILSVNSQMKVPASWWHAENRTATMKFIADAQAQAGEIVGFGVQAAGHAGNQLTVQACPVCNWIHDASFTQIRAGEEAISLRGVLPDIVRIVHGAHEKGLAGTSTKDEQLQKICGGYYSPCKAFHGLKRQREYRLLFDTSRRGMISLRGAIGKNWNKSESGSE